MQVIKQTEALVFGLKMHETSTFSADPTHFFVSFPLSPELTRKSLEIGSSLLAYVPSFLHEITYLAALSI